MNIGLYTEDKISLGESVIPIVSWEMLETLSCQCCEEGKAVSKLVCGGEILEDYLSLSSHLGEQKSVKITLW